MTRPRYCVKQDDHQKLICRGLTSLQQEEDLVDMTIAADGHYVKVHKIIMSVASPYFKQIISDTVGHPVVYLNKVSFATLCAILEYIYSGESRIDDDKLEEFIQVSKDLQINGLMGLVPQTSDLKNPYNPETDDYDNTVEYLDNTIISPVTDCEKETASIDPLPDDTNPLRDDTNPLHEYIIPSKEKKTSKRKISQVDDQLKEESTKKLIIDDDEALSNSDTELDNTADTGIDTAIISSDKAKLHFTISNQGTLQAIFNRYIYNQTYVYKKNKNLRQWRCYHQRNPQNCPAVMVTEHDKIIKRIQAHNHSFHDRIIIKKMKKDIIYDAINDAETHVTNTPKFCRV